MVDGRNRRRPTGGRSALGGFRGRFWCRCRRSQVGQRAWLRNHGRRTRAVDHAVIGCAVPHFEVVFRALRTGVIRLVDLVEIAQLDLTHADFGNQIEVGIVGDFGKSAHRRTGRAQRVISSAAESGSAPVIRPKILRREHAVGLLRHRRRFDFGTHIRTAITAAQRLFRNHHPASRTRILVRNGGDAGVLRRGFRGTVQRLPAAGTYLLVSHRNGAARGTLLDGNIHWPNLQPFNFEDLCRGK